MIDWNVELTNSIAKKEQTIADNKAKKLAEQQKKEQARLDYIEYCKVFDQVIQEEIAGVRTILDTCSDRFKYTIEISTGNVFFKLEAIQEKYRGCGHESNFSCEYNPNIDLATYTRQRLSNLITFFVLCFCGGKYYSFY